MWKLCGQSGVKCLYSGGAFLLIALSIQEKTKQQARVFGPYNCGYGGGMVASLVVTSRPEPL